MRLLARCSVSEPMFSRVTGCGTTPREARLGAMARGAASSRFDNGSLLCG